MELYFEIIKVLKDLLSDCLATYTITSATSGASTTSPAIRLRPSGYDPSITYSIPPFDYTALSLAEKAQLAGVECILDIFPFSLTVEQLGLFGGAIATRYYKVVCYQHNLYAPLDKAINALISYDGLFYLRSLNVVPVRERQGTKQGFDPAEVHFILFVRQQGHIPAFNPVLNAAQ